MKIRETDQIMLKSKNNILMFLVILINYISYFYILYYIVRKAQH